MTPVPALLLLLSATPEAGVAATGPKPDLRAGIVYFIDRPTDVVAPIGALVRWVDPESPADKAGIRAFDVVTSVNGRQVTSGPAAVGEWLHADRSRCVPMCFVRGTETRDVCLSGRPSASVDLERAMKESERRAPVIDIRDRRVVPPRDATVLASGKATLEDAVASAGLPPLGAAIICGNGPIGSVSRTCAPAGEWPWTTGQAQSLTLYASPKPFECVFADVRDLRFLEVAAVSGRFAEILGPTTEFRVVTSSSALTRDCLRVTRVADQCVEIEGGKDARWCVK